MPSFRNNAVDPQQISSAFDSIANAFKVTPQEILAGAKSRETLQKVQYLSDAYKLAQDPNADVGKLDRIASIAGAYTPNQSWTAIDRNNATTLKANAADNSRALATNAADNQNKITLKLMDPLGPDQVGYNPPSVASMYGVPEMRRGIVKVNESQNAVLPNGETIAGTPKPLSTDQLNAQTIATLGPDARRQSAMGSIPVETIVSAATGKPTIVSRADAIGQSPAPDTQKAQFFNYDTPDGKSGTARTDGSGKLVDTQTGAELPAGSRTYTAQLTGNKSDTGLGASTKSAIENQLADAANLESTVNQIENIVNTDPGAIGTTGRVAGLVQDAVATGKEVAKMLAPVAPQAQKYLNDVETGALPPEMAKYFNPNIPQATLLENTLLAQYVKMNDPNGRMSNQQMEIARDALGIGGPFRSAEHTKAIIAGIRKSIAAKRAMLGNVAPAANAIRPADTPQGGPAPAPAGGGDATFVRGPNGKLVRAQ